MILKRYPSSDGISNGSFREQITSRRGSTQVIPAGVDHPAEKKNRFRWRNGSTDLSHSFKPVQQQQNNRDASSTSTGDSRSNDIPMQLQSRISKRTTRSHEIFALDLRALLIFSGIYGDDGKSHDGTMAQFVVDEELFEKVVSGIRQVIACSGALSRRSGSSCVGNSTRHRPTSGLIGTSSPHTKFESFISGSETT